MKNCHMCRSEASRAVAAVLCGVFLLVVLCFGSWTFFLISFLLAVFAYDVNWYLSKSRERHCANVDCSCACHFFKKCACKCHYWCGGEPITKDEATPQSCGECDWRHVDEQFSLTAYDSAKYNCHCRCHKMKLTATACECGCHRWCNRKF